MKILQLGMGWFPEQPGGANRFYYNLIRELAVGGHEITAAIAGTNPEPLAGVDVRAFAPIKAPIFRRWSNARQSLLELVPQADLIASHFALYTFPIADQLRRKPLVVHFQGPWAEESAVEGSGWLSVSAKRLVEKCVYRSARRFVVLGDAFRKILVEDYSIPHDKIEVLPAGVDASRFAPTMSREAARDVLAWPKERKILLAVRRLVRRMGLENLIEAVAELRKRHPDILLMIGGRGPLRVELQARIEQLGLQDHVRLLGFVSDDILPLVYRAANLSVVPSVSLEGFGIITIESMATGTPVLVTPVGGLPETVRGLSSDLIMPGSSVGVITDYIDNVLRGALVLPDETRCREHVLRHFDWPVVARRYEKLYMACASS